MDAFAYFGGVPHRISDDTVRTAVRVWREGEEWKREEVKSFVAFRSHYLFEAHYCTPWEPHEKGGVENGVGYVRGRMFVPLPKVKNYEELNRVLRKRCERENNRKVRGESQQIGELWEEERQRLRPVPQRSYEHAEIREARVTPDSQVVFETNRYSLPVKRGREQGSGEGVSFSDRNCGRDEGVGTP
jgi:transposase